jgi:hypothetical protein
MRHEEAGESNTGDVDTHMVDVPLHMEDTSKSGVTSGKTNHSKLVFNY